MLYTIPLDIFSEAAETGYYIEWWIYRTRDL